jgi:hypothetical protein
MEVEFVVLLCPVLHRPLLHRSLGGSNSRRCVGVERRWRLREHGHKELGLVEFSEKYNRRVCAMGAVARPAKRCTAR